MNYEKKYKEALEKAKELYSQHCAEWRDEDIEHIFPELKESEDEKIRKELLEHCKNQAKPYIQTGNECPQIQSWIDWLEKQGEQKYTQKDVDDAYLKGVSTTKRMFEKQQKPTWSEDDERICQCLIRKQEEQEESVENPILKQIYCERMDWLKSLKGRVQPKQEWNEENINMIDWLIRCCEEEHKELCNDKYGHQDIVSDLKSDCRKKWDWLESLKNRVVPQNTWKPSDKQIEALKAMARYCEIATSFDAYKQKVVESLYSELKKLKEE